MIDPQLSVRPMRLDDVCIRVSYFHDATDEYLRHLGVDRALLPTPDEWFESYRVTTPVRCLIARRTA